MKHGAIFDMDGTLLDTEKFYTRGWIEVADKFNLERKPEIANAMRGTGLKFMPDILKKFYPNVDPQKYVSLVLEFCKEETEKNLQLMDGVKEILEFMKSQNILMAVASSSIKKSVEENLRRTDIKKYFNAIIGGDEVAKGKPEPDIFLKAAEELKISPNDCYVFEDSFNGIIAGHSAGALTIMIPDQVQPNEEIKKICHIYKNMFEAMKAIQCGEI